MQFLQSVDVEVKGRGLLIEFRAEEDRLLLLGHFLFFVGDSRAGYLLQFGGRDGLFLGFMLMLELQEHY